MALVHIMSAGLLATGLTIAGGALDSGRTGQPTPAQQAYPDTPHGVDAMVTGPVSASFREQQETAGCGAAKWPDVPLACYPQ